MSCGWRRALGEVEYCVFVHFLYLFISVGRSDFVVDMFEDYLSVVMNPLCGLDYVYLLRNYYLIFLC